jgi:hypothetical protein
VNLDETEKAMEEFCRAAWRIRQHMANKQHTELLISHIFTAMEMAKAAG